MPSACSSGFDAMIDGKHLRGQQLRVVAADENLHRFFAHFLADLVDVSLRDQVAAGDQHDAVGDAVDLIEDVAGDEEMHSLAAKLLEERDAIRRAPWDRVRSAAHREPAPGDDARWPGQAGSSGACLCCSRRSCGRLHRRSCTRSRDSHGEPEGVASRSCRGASGYRRQTASRSMPRGKESNCVQ